ncbi:DUF1214 domain-containing protein [Paraburkholderia oxyphila]|uniref:DUF1214 domain-containing protein n=1 Tax=Paraburkholderia oxyphila TaxID=614212 RepID=UPI0004845E63|nr:DUF1214 domain-containing protein [Paraburkholderia oxyphila]
MRTPIRAVVAALCAASAAVALDACKTSTPPAAAVQQAAPAGEAAALRVSDQDISDAWIYLMGRLLVLRQQRLDFERNGFQWNQLVHRTPGGVEWANPNLDVVYSEAWIAVDEHSCVLLDIPRIEGRYYTWQMLDGWGETILNINERTFAGHPHGRYALCLKGSQVSIPADALRVDLPVRTARALLRVELGDSAAQAEHLQHAFRLTPLGEPKIPAPIQVPLFANTALPRAQAFDFADAILAGQPDLNPGMDAVRTKVGEVAELVRSGAAGRQRVDDVVAKLALPALAGRLRAPGPRANGWAHPTVIGTYGGDYLQRTAVDFAGIWANTPAEVTYFAMPHLDGGATYTQTFAKDALPQAQARYFWSVMAVDATHYRVMHNPLDRYTLNRQSKIRPNADGSVTLAYGPRKPDGVPESNWLPTPSGEQYNLTFRLYGQISRASEAPYYPPPLVKLENQ